MVKRIIIDGLIGSGKSTVIEQLGHFFKKKDVRVFPELVDTWTELPLFYEDPASWCLPLNLRVLLTQKLQYDESVQHGDDEQMHIFERSPLSCRHVFCQLHFNEGVLSQKQWQLFKDYYELLKWEPMEDDLIIYIDTSVDTCHSRISERAREGEEPIDLKYLHKLDFQYQNNLLKYTKCPVLRVDGNLSKDEVVQEVYTILKNFCVGV